MKKEKRTRKIIAVQKLETHGCSGAFKKVSGKNFCHKVTTTDLRLPIGYQDNR